VPAVPPDADAPPRRRQPPAKQAPRAGLIGPLFSWELLRLARRGQDARARFILAAGLFVILTAFALIWFRSTTTPWNLFFGGSQTMRLNESAAFGEAFSLTFVLAQLGVLCLLTPAYAAGGIADEKERKTLVFLLASDLTAREIVLGKFLGRLVFLLGVTAAGLPILTITLVQGGVTTKFLLVSYFVTAGTVVLLASISAACAASADTLRGALLRAYGLTAVVVFTGCGLFQLLSPFGVIVFLYWVEPSRPEVFWLVGIIYPLAAVGLSIGGVALATAAVRSMRAKLTAERAFPPAAVMERYYFEDHEAARKAQKRIEKRLAKRLDRDAKLEEPTVAPVGADGQSLPPVAVPVARAPVVDGAIPIAEPAERLKPLPLPPPRPDQSRAHRPPPDPEAPPKPRLGSNDPFLWKEQYAATVGRSADDEAIRAMVYLLGGIMATVLGLFLVIALMTVVVNLNTSRSTEAARWLMLTAGAAGLFAHQLQMGMAASGTVCRERQRLTLESLLTIPVSRRAILWPKWFTCASKGWWWGGPAMGSVLLSFLIGPVPILAIPVVVFILAGPPLVVSFALRLSVISKSTNRALLWTLPLVAFLTLYPIVVAAWAEKDTWFWWFLPTVLLAGVGWLGAVLYWRQALKDFSKETVIRA
jgi:ABC-type transport system involved in multi-copper enzyme maturation permease subunit